MKPYALLLPAALLLASCGPVPVRLAVPPAPVGEPVAVAFASVEVLDVSLPAYAEGEEVYVRDPDFLLTRAPAMWADDPARAVTLDLVRALGDGTSARVAGEPWPYDEPPAARLDVRVAEFVADEATGAFVLSGQYFVGAFDGSGRARRREFAISAPIAPGADLAGLAAARGEATVALAREIAAEGLR